MQSIEYIATDSLQSIVNYTTSLILTIAPMSFSKVNISIKLCVCHFSYLRINDEPKHGSGERAG